jgi:hypothetical protein
MRERVQTATASANLTAPDDTRRVIVRYADGTTLRGYFSAEDAQGLKNNVADRVSIRGVGGKLEDVEVSGLKAIFFVKSFEGTQNYSEFKVFTHQPSGKGVWVRVHFHDGEVMEGIAPNSLGTFAGKVFSLTPPDPQSNNETVFISKNCLKEMQILGLASD